MRHGKEHRRVPFDGATSDYPARLHAPLYGRAHISYAVGKLVAPPRWIMPCVIALFIIERVEMVITRRS